MQCCRVVKDTKIMVHDKERYRKEFSISSERSERIPEASDKEAIREERVFRKHCHLSLSRAELGR